MVLERPQGDGNLYHAYSFKSQWMQEHGEVFLHLLLKLFQDGTISEDGNVAEETWLKIHNGLRYSTKCIFPIDFLKECLSDYMQLYNLLIAETNSSVFHWGRENKTICINYDLQKESSYRELLLLCGAYIPYFDTLEKVCSSLNTRRSSEQHVSETSTNISNENLVQDISRPSNIRTKFHKSRKSLKRLLTCSKIG